MTSKYTEIRVRGKNVEVPSAWIGDRRVIVSGKLLKIAAPHDEELLESEAVHHPASFIPALKRSGLKADIFTFAQALTQPTPVHRYYFEWDNAAVIPITSFADWWHKRSRYLRRDVKRAKHRGVVVRPVELTDGFLRGILEIYNETPIRQGRRFWHYGKDFANVKHETATYLDRAEFLGAYYNEELIGFLKIVYVGQVGRLMLILSKIAHQDKRTTNALIAEAVRLCEMRECSHLIYGKFTYGRNLKTSLTDFKHRNGFEQILFPRYFIPLTLKGRVGLTLNLQHGVRGIIPPKLLELARASRARLMLTLIRDPERG